MTGDLAHLTGDLAHMTGDLAHVTGDLAYTTGDLAHKSEDRGTSLIRDVGVYSPLEGFLDDIYIYKAHIHRAHMCI